MLMDIIYAWLGLNALVFVIALVAYLTHKGEK